MRKRGLASASYADRPQFCGGSLRTRALLLSLPLVFAGVLRAKNHRDVPAPPRAVTTQPAIATASYHVIEVIPLASSKYFDDTLTFESSTRRLFTCDGSNIIVVNADTGQLIGTIAKVGHVSDIALAPDINRGFLAAWQHHQLVVFDLQKLTIISQIHTGEESAFASYDPLTKQVLTASPTSKNMKVFDAMTGNMIKTVELKEYVYGSHVDSSDEVYLALDHNAAVRPPTVASRISPWPRGLFTADEIAVLDARTFDMKHIWKEPSCKAMQIIGIDSVRHQLVAACERSVAFIDPDSGEIIKSTEVAGLPLTFFRFNSDLAEVFLFEVRPPELMVLRENSRGEMAEGGFIPGEAHAPLAFDTEKRQFFILKSDERVSDTGLMLEVPGADPQKLKIPEPVPGTFRIAIYGEN